MTSDSPQPPPVPASRAWWAAIRKVVGFFAVAVVGAVIGWSLAPSTTMTVGPLEVAVDPQLRLGPATVLELPPVGDVSFDSHLGPLALDLSVRSIDLSGAQALISSPDELAGLRETAPDAATHAVTSAVLLAIGCASVGAAAAGLLTYRRPRRALQCGAVALVPLLGCAALAALSFDARQLSQPTFTGLLSRAPYVLQEGRSTIDRLESYRSGVEDLTRSVATLYSTANQLPGAAPSHGAEVTTILHVSDIHLNPQAFDLIRTLVQQFGVQAVVDTGDITTWGTPAESQTLAPIADLGVPYVFVRGNHDSPETAAAVAAMPNATVLDNSTVEVAGLRLAGIGDPTFTPDGQEGSRADSAAAASDLARTIASSRQGGEPVDIALIHNPSGVDALMGEVPLVLSGHMHTRATRLDESGTRVMVEGSTGGAGISAGALDRLTRGTPLPLEATLLYFAADDPTSPPGSERRLAFFDNVSVGGLGLASASLQRTTVDPDDEPDTEPLPDVTPADRSPTVDPPASPSASTAPTGQPAPIGTGAAQPGRARSSPG